MDTSPVALITAGSAGLGAATARLFAKQGYRVIINFSNNYGRANKLVEDLSALSSLSDEAPASNFVAIQADLASRADIQRLVEEAVAAMGRLDVVFSNGGWTRFRDMASLDENAFEEDWDKAFNINVKSHLWLMHAAKIYLDATEGAFISTASTAGMSHSGSSLAYSVTKAAQIHLVKGLAHMAAPKIRVNSVSPGLLLTEWSDRFSEQAKEAYRQKTRLQRFPTVEDVAEQVFTFARSKSMTGCNIALDSGFTL